jgi:SPP1 family predicted phage head-tail adaptor
MRAGRLRHLIQIQAKSVTRNSLGEEIVTWTTVHTCWAAIEPLSGQELLRAQAESAEMDVRIVIRWREGIKPEMRVIWAEQGGHTYNIRAVVNARTAQRDTQLMCQEFIGG